MAEYQEKITRRQGEMGATPHQGPATDAFCPYLGWYVDAQTHHSYPSGANHCHTQSPPLTIELAYQASTCLEGDWGACPRYKAAQAEGVFERPTTFPWLVPAQTRRLPTWAIATLIMAALALVAGLLLVLRPVVSAPSPASPTRDLVMITSIPASGGGAVSAASPSPTSASVSSATSEAVVAPTDTPSPTPSPTSSPTPTVTPTETTPPSPTATPSPTSSSRVAATSDQSGLAAGTSTATRTPTRTATATRTPSPTATPTRQPTQTPRPTLQATRAVATATPEPASSGVSLSAPVLVSPANLRTFAASDPVVLSWQSVGPLAPNEYYVPTVAYLHFGETWYDETPWTKETSWTLSDHRYLLDLSDNGEFRWAVRVMGRTGINDKGQPTGVARSPMSEVRVLVWRRDSGGGGGQATSEPPPP